MAEYEAAPPLQWKEKMSLLVVSSRPSPVQHTKNELSYWSNAGTIDKTTRGIFPLRFSSGLL